MKIIAPRDLPILEILALLSPESSKNTLRSWLEKGRVLVAGQVVKKATALIQQGQEVSIGKRTHFIREGVEVLLEDRSVAVINKPEGLLSVATDFDKQFNAHEILKEHIHPGRVFPVHRLDRETSGVMVFAFNEKARDSLKEQFFHHSIEREYFAIVEGLLETNSGTWRSFLAEDESYVVHEAPQEGGRLAITHYRVVSRTRKLTLLQLNLETGRKNQIRVHCRTAGHPVHGDVKYCAELPAQRLFLHAHKLSFNHPETGKKMTFTVPLPEAFHKIVG